MCIGLGLKGRFLLPAVVPIVPGTGFSVSMSGIIAGKRLTASIKALVDQAAGLPNRRITAFVKDRKSEIRARSC